jgi:type VI secretion system protein ImpB
MSTNHGAQKFIERNRPPRVQISAPEEVNGAKIKVELPFVAGVMADLSGKWDEPDDVPASARSVRGSLEERKFVEFDQQNFDKRMAAMNPTVSFNVPNALTGEGSIPVNLKFKSMEDFSPDRIAEQIESLRRLLETRKKLQQLKNRASNKPTLESALEKIISDPELMKSLYGKKH